MVHSGRGVHGFSSQKISGLRVFLRDRLQSGLCSFDSAVCLSSHQAESSSAEETERKTVNLPDQVGRNSSNGSQAEEKPKEGSETIVDLS